MGTIDHALADRIRAGEFNDEVAYLVEYRNAWGGESVGTLGWRDDPRRYHDSPACSSVRVVWTNPNAKPWPKGDQP